MFAMLNFLKMRYLGEKGQDAIEYAVTSGVKGIFTAHGSDLEQIEHNPILNQLIINGYIEKVLAMDKQRNVHLLYEKQSKRK